MPMEKQFSTDRRLRLQTGIRIFPESGRTGGAAVVRLGEGREKAVLLHRVRMALLRKARADLRRKENKARLLPCVRPT